MPVSQRSFGETQGQAVSLFEMVNSRGNRVTMTNYGAILVTVEVPDRHGNVANVNLGYDTLDKYLERHPYLGATVGRFCNRIAAGQFELEGKTYDLAVNNGPNHLHGGIDGFDRVVWQAEPFSEEGLCGVRFRMTSPDGDEGYPGALTVSAEYSWSDQDELRYQFEATTDAPTVLNLTNHAYWNLSGGKRPNILEHEVQLMCDRYLEVDEHLIPTGRILPTAGTDLCFSKPRVIGTRMDKFPMTSGYDHCYVVNGAAGEQPRLAGVAVDPESGRKMEVFTTQPGMQLYTGNHLGGDHPAYSGLCMETQHYPDAPNKPEFPSTRLNPGETFREVTLHKFSLA